MTYGERIRRGREAKALTQEELAEALGVSRQAVSKWEGDLSRPAAGKLALLSETLDIPWDAWQAMDAEEAAAQAAARETEGERRARKWRRGSAALAALLCLSLLINVLLWAKLHPAEDGPAGETSPIAAFPEILTIRVSRDYRFGDETPEEDPKNPWQIPFLKDDLVLQEHELLAAYFEDINALGQHFLSVVKADPRQEQDFTLWNLYVIWATADERGDLDFQILYQAACDVSTPNKVSWQRFENVLGYSGFRLNVPGFANDYLVLGEDGVPKVLASLGGGDGTMDYDVDEDGQKEIVCPGGFGVWTVYDTVEGQDWADIYEIRSETCGVSTLYFSPEKGGFFVADVNPETGEEGAVLVRYQLQDGAFLRREPTGITQADYPDAAGTKLHFDLDYFYDSVDPDTVLTTESGLRLTPRQQAYLALQQLYEFTGVKLEEVYCAVSGAGETCFSLWEDGFTDRCFYSADMPEAYGGSGIPSVTFTWQEQGADWSPLSVQTLAGERYLPAEHADALRDAYRRLPLMQSGSLANVQADQLWLSDGSLYTADFFETAFGPALTYLTGPYPDGEVHH